MFYKNRIWMLVLSCVFCVSLLSGCGNQNDGSSGKAKYSVVCTIFPEYDWVREVLGERSEEFELTLLLDNGVDLHNYQPSAEDIAKLGACDLFIYVGGESDEWVEPALQQVENPDRQVINLLEVLGDSVKEEEIIEGMEVEEEDKGKDQKEDDENGEGEGKVETEDGENEEGEGKAETEDGENEEETEYDEHVWLSLRNASVCVDAIADALAVIDSGNAKAYLDQADAYKKELEALDQEYQETVGQAEQKTLLFGDRFPFRYMAEDYGLTYLAAFAGCSAETEASFETTAFLSQKVDELGLQHVCVIEGSDGKLAQTIIDNTKAKDQDIVSFHSMQSVTAKDAEDGMTYLTVMEKNLEALNQALAQ